MTKHISLTRPQTAGKGIGQETGALSQKDQNAEAYRLIDIIMNLAQDGLTDWEQRFIDSICKHPESPITGRQLFTLRDIKDKYLD